MRFIDLSGRKILVTGASSGISRATATLLSRLGAAVVLCARDQGRLQETLDGMEHPQRHVVAPFDVRDFDAYDRLFQMSVADGVKLTGLVHSAGIAKAVPLRMLRKESIDEIFDVNCSAFLCLAAKYARKKYSDGGSIVGISAVNAHYPHKCMGIYAASKGALEASVRTLAVELAAQGIRINSVIPGAVKTSMADSMDGDTLRSIAGRQLLGMETPGQVADVIAYLISDRSSCITGRNIFADGGLLGQWASRDS